MILKDPKVVPAREVRQGDLLVERTQTVRVLYIEQHFSRSSGTVCAIRARPIGVLTGDRSHDLYCCIPATVNLPLVATVAELTTAIEN